MAVGDVYRCQFQMTLAGKTVSTDLHYEETSPRTGTIAEVTSQLIALAQTGFWTTFWRPYCSDKMTFLQSIGQMIYPTREAPVYDASLYLDPGASTGDPMNGQTAVLIAQYGTAWSREFQGRAFLPGMDEINADEGRMDSIVALAVSVAAQLFYTQVHALGAPGGGTYTPTVLSPKRLKASTPPVTSILLAATLRNRISRQVKRRTPLTSTT